LALELLTKKQLDVIHSSALNILERIGVKVLTKQALKIFSDAGAHVDEKSGIVKIPSHVVEEAIKKTPKSLELVGRDKKNKIFLERGRTYTRASTGLMNVLDLESGEWRKANINDVLIVARIIDYLDRISINSTHLFPSDVPLEACDVYSFKIVLENSSKHIVVSPLELENLKGIWNMASVIMDEESLRKFPLFSVLNCPNSPLILRDDISIFCAEHNIPTIVNSAPIVGVSSPITLAGTMVQQSAEALATITLLQLVNPRSPVIWGCKSTPLDMRYGSPLAGAVEIGLLSVGAVQVAHYYGLPAEGFGPRTDSKVLDEQAGVERVFVGLLPALAGAEIISGAGCLEAVATLSIEQLLIDNEFYGMMFRTLKGIDFSDDKLAIDVIARVGIGGNYLKDISTAKYYRSEFFIPSLFDKRDRSAWKASGAKRVEQIAKERAKKILSEYEPTPLSKEEKERLNNILKEFEKKMNKVAKR